MFRGKTYTVVCLCVCLFLCVDVEVEFCVHSEVLVFCLIRASIVCVNVMSFL